MKVRSFQEFEVLVRLIECLVPCSVLVLRARVVGWPPVRSYRKNALADVAGSSKAAKKFVKVAVDGAPYLRKVDLEAYAGYDQLLCALQDKFFAHFTIRQYTATYLPLSMSGFPLLCLRFIDCSVLMSARREVW
jgi:hypothetical protein